MSGLLRRLKRRRAATVDEAPTAVPEVSESAEAPADAPAEPGGGDAAPARTPAAGDQRPQSGSGEPTGDERGQDKSSPASAVRAGVDRPSPDEQPTELIPQTDDEQAAGAQPSAGETAAVEPPAAGGDALPAPAPPTDVVATPSTDVVAAPSPADSQPDEAQAGLTRDLPAGVDPGEFQAAPSTSARRGKLRRRLRYLQRVRGLLLRDLGGFTYEIHRTAGGILRESHRRLVETKTGRLAMLDAEVRELEGRLGRPHAEAVLREPGIGGTCPACGELHATDAHYCSRCGEPLDAKARAEREAAIRAAAQPPAPQPTAQPKAASVLWAAGPRPTAGAGTPAPSPHADRGSSATGEWLARSPGSVEDASESEAGGAAAADDEERTTAEPDTTGTAAETPAAAGTDAPGAEEQTPAAAASEKPGAAGETGEPVTGGGEAATGTSPHDLAVVTGEEESGPGEEASDPGEEASDPGEQSGVQADEESAQRPAGAAGDARDAGPESGPDQSRPATRRRATRATTADSPSTEAGGRAKARQKRTSRTAAAEEAAKPSAGKSRPRRSTRAASANAGADDEAGEVPGAPDDPAADSGREDEAGPTGADEGPSAAGPNGRLEEDVTRRLPSGDPLGSRERRT